MRTKEEFLVQAEKLLGADIETIAKALRETYHQGSIDYLKQKVIDAGGTLPS